MQRLSRFQTFGFWLASCLYLAASTTLSPLSEEILTTEQLRLWNHGLKPYIDFQWYYGIFPFVIYGFPVRWLGEGLLLQRIIAAIIALSILWQSHCLLDHLRITRNKFTTLGLIALISVPQQHSHGHTLVTLAAILGFRLLMPEKGWRLTEHLKIVACGVLALGTKPLFGGWVIACFLPLAGFFFKKTTRLGALALILSCLGLLCLTGWATIGQFNWLGAWWNCLLDAIPNYQQLGLFSQFLTRRIEYLTFFFNPPWKGNDFRDFAASQLPLLVYDGIIVFSIICIFSGKMSRHTRAWFALTLGITFQSLFTGEASLLGYAQEIFPLCLILFLLVLEDLSNSKRTRIAHLFLKVLIVLFGVRYADVFTYEPTFPRGTGNFQFIHMLPSDKKWSDLGSELPTIPNAMSLGGRPPLLPTFQCGTPNYGAIEAGFLTDTCFQERERDEHILSVLTQKKPALICLTQESIQSAHFFQSLSWIETHYHEIFPKNSPPNARFFLNRQGKQ